MKSADGYFQIPYIITGDYGSQTIYLYLITLVISR